MDGGAVERVLAIANAQEPGGLLKGLGADAGDLLSCDRERNFPCSSR